MITIRRAAERGVADFHWLNSQHTFSFGQYFDPAQMGFGVLRVINEDRVIAGEGFATHSHQNMEIISYVISGALEHKDSLGTGSIILPGDVQRMTAGSGISHSEYNPSKTDPVHFLQIWILPAEDSLEPSYEQKHYEITEKLNQLRLVASQDGRDHSVLVHQDVNLYASNLVAGKTLSYGIEGDRHVWLQVVTGKVRLNDTELTAGDGAAITQAQTIDLTGLSDNSEFLLFDLAAVNSGSQNG
jgi:redox-sensitive bicupin YhaK (pirin superfamily)